MNRAINEGKRIECEKRLKMPEQLMKEPLGRVTALSARKPLSNELVLLEPKS